MFSDAENRVQSIKVMQKCRATQNRSVDMQNVHTDTQDTYGLQRILAKVLLAVQ